MLPPIIPYFDMTKINRFIYKCHKWFGIPLALMFIMWYCSGIVMMYHGFPRLRPSRMPVEKVDSTALSALWKSAPDSIGHCRISFSGKRLQLTVDGNTLGGYKPDLNDLKSIANSFSTVIQRVDTLQDIDKWIPFDNLMRHLPIYRIVGNDDSFTYVSSLTGEVLQHASLSQRRWAWVGALPHYFYITPIRRDAKLWRSVVIWMSGLSTVSVLFGIIIAIRFLIKKRKFKLFKKRTWQWHYCGGLFFGVFMLSFIFSGMMSLADIPDWIMKSHPLAEEGRDKVSKSELDISTLPKEFGQVTLSTFPQIMWNVVKGKESNVVRASDAILDFSPAFMISVIQRQTGEQVENVTYLENDLYYNTSAKQGYRANTNNFTVYWNDKGYYRVLDSKQKAQYICYRFLHTMKIPGLKNVKWLHSLFMWIILLGGLTIVGTGTILSVMALKK